MRSLRLLLEARRKKAWVSKGRVTARSMQLSFHTPTEEDLALVKKRVKEYSLDNEDLHAGQFIIAKKGDEIVGFGRLRKHNDALELCTLGVVEQHRGKGIGRAIMNELIKRAGSKLYVCCVIPGFFKKFGFEETESFPASMARKQQRCITEYPVEENYCVMSRS